MWDVCPIEYVEKTSLPSSGPSQNSLEHFRSVEAANQNCLMTRGVPANDLHRTAGAVEFIGQQIDQSLIGGGIDWRRGHFDFQLMAERFADFIFGGARLNFDGEANAVRV